jgi:hypothetical protein
MTSMQRDLGLENPIPTTEQITKELQPSPLKRKADGNLENDTKQMRIEDDIINLDSITDGILLSVKPGNIKGDVFVRFFAGNKVHVHYRWSPEM